MQFTIPLSPGVPFFRQRTQLDGRDYLLSFFWNEREEAWYLQLDDEAGVPIAAGIKLVLDWPLIGRVADARRPPGSLMAVDPSGNPARPGLQDLGTRVQLVYADAAEVAAMKAASP